MITCKQQAKCFTLTKSGNLKNNYFQMSIHVATQTASQHYTVRLLQLFFTQVYSHVFE